MPHDLMLIWIVMSSMYCCTSGALTRLEDLGTKYVGEDVIIPWKYDNEQDMLFVDWRFESKDSIVKTVMSQAQGNNAVVYDGFNIQHNGNGQVKLLNVTTHNTGNYSCVVTYSSSVDSDSVELTVKEPGNMYVIMCSVAIATMASLLAVTIVVIICCHSGSLVICKLSISHIVLFVINIVAFAYSIAVASVAAFKISECIRCEETCGIDKCGISLGLSITSYILAMITLFETIICTLLIRKGKFRKQYISDKPDTEPAIPSDEKEKEGHKDQSNGDKHETAPKGRPIPTPSGNNKPMPEIPSDKHKRGLSSNFHDDSDKPLDDNILHTLPVPKPKQSLEPVGLHENTDDQPKKKKKKKKDRDTSRSEEI